MPVFFGKEVENAFNTFIFGIYHIRLVNMVTIQMFKNLSLFFSFVN